MVKNLFYVIVVLVMIMSSCMDEPELGMDKDYPIITTGEALMEGKHSVMTATVRLPAGIESLSDVGFYIYRNPPLSKEDSDPFEISAKNNFTNKGFTLTLDDELLIKFHDTREYSLRYQAYLKKDGITHIGELVDLPFNLPEGPVIELIRPVKGVKGDTITISGKNFYPSFRPEVFFGNNKANSIFASPDSMKVIVPAGNGSTEVQISINSGGVKRPSSSSFVYQNPVIESISPKKSRGNDVITIKGNHFGHRGTKITIKGINFTLLSANNQEAKIQLNNNDDILYSGIKSPVLINHDGLSGSSQDSLVIVNEWRKLKSFTSLPEVDFFFQSNNEIYIGYGGNRQSEPRFFKYDFKMDDFVELQISPPTHMMFGVVFNIHESSYFVYLYNKSTHEYPEYSFKMVKFDGKAQSWSILPDPLVEFHVFGYSNFLVFSSGDYGYLASKSKLFKYSVITNSWQVLDSLPLEVEPYQATAFSIGNKVYFGTGGNNGSTSSKAFFEMDVISNNISRLNDFPYDMDYAIGFSIGQNGYLGARYGFPYLFQYSPEQDSWAHITKFPIEKAAFCKSVVINSKAYVFCPMNNGEFYEFDPAYLDEQ